MEQETQQKLDGILEIVQFLKDNAVMRTDLTRVEQDVSAVKTRLNSIEQKLTSLEQGQSSINIRLDSIEKELQGLRKDFDMLERRTREDADVSVKDIFDLKRRIEELENQMRRLQRA